MTNITKYHAHVYWSNKSQREAAIMLRPLLESLGGVLGRVHDVPIGPHPLAMYQVEYTETNKSQIESLLNLKNEGNSILLHEDTGNDVKDHTENIRWINELLDLDIKWLEENGH